MALIIKGDMPTKCCLGGCPIHESCNKYDVLADTRPSDCPILGEIPDEHGRLIDADALEYSLGIEDEALYVKYTLDEAPTVLEAST